MKQSTKIVTQYSLRQVMWSNLYQPVCFLQLKYAFSLDHCLNFPDFLCIMSEHDKTLGSVIFNEIHKIWEEDG